MVAGMASRTASMTSTANLMRLAKLPPYASVRVLLSGERKEQRR